MAISVHINKEIHTEAFGVIEKLAEQENRTLTNVVETLLLEDGKARIARNDNACQEKAG